MHFFARNSRTDDAVCADAFWWSSTGQIIYNFHSNSHHPLSQMVWEVKIILVVLNYCDSRWYKFFMDYSARIGRNNDHFLNFHLLMLAFFCLGDCGVCVCVFVPFLTVPLGFRVIIQNPTFVSYHDSIQKIWFNFETFKHFCRHFVSKRFWSQLKFFGTIFQHDFLMLNSCTTILWTVNSLTLSSSAIIRTVKCRSWWMKALTRSTFCACSHRGGASRSRFVFHRFSLIYNVFLPQKYLSTWRRIITKYFLNLFIGIGSTLPQLDTKRASCCVLQYVKVIRWTVATTKYIFIFATYFGHIRTIIR
jgi:hypothetical protein